jgi:hypothetical protein
MDPTSSLFLFCYFLELWRRARELDRLEAELTGEVSGVFERRSGPLPLLLQPPRSGARKKERRRWATRFNWSKRAKSA